MNKDTAPNLSNLTPCRFEETIPDVSWYRHQTWLPGQFKRFRHYHTFCQDITGFEFYNDKTSPEFALYAKDHAAGGVA